MPYHKLAERRRFYNLIHQRSSDFARFALCDFNLLSARSLFTSRHLAATSIRIRLKDAASGLRSELSRTRPDRRAQWIEGCTEIRTARWDARLSDIVIGFDPQLRFLSWLAAAVRWLFGLVVVSVTIHPLGQNRLGEKQSHGRRQYSARDCGRSSSEVHRFLTFAGITTRCRWSSSLRSAARHPAR